jgi:hypothetical protein
MTLPKEHLEDEIWSLIRMSPEKLPLETYKCCLFFLSAFEASKTEFQNVIASIEKQQNDTSCYTLEYKKVE